MIRKRWPQEGRSPISNRQRGLGRCRRFSRTPSQSSKKKSSKLVGCMTRSTLLLLRLKAAISRRLTCHPPSWWIAQSELRSGFLQTLPRGSGAFCWANLFHAWCCSRLLNGCQDLDRSKAPKSKAHFQCPKSKQERAAKKRQFFWTPGHDLRGESPKNVEANLKET